MARSATFAPWVSVSLAVLFAVLASVANAPALTLAVFTRSPAASGALVPLIVIVRLLPGPGGIVAFVKLTALAADPFVPHEPPVVATQSTVTPEIAAGTVSKMLTSVAVDGPPF